MDEMEKKLMDAILDFDEDDVIEQVRALLNTGKDPVEIAKVCRQAMDDIGRMFQEKEIFLTELIMSGELLSIVMEELGFSTDTGDKPDSEYKGKVLMGTVAGDVHDIGKNIVNSLLRSNDYKVVDIGVDVPVNKFAEEVTKNNPDVVGMCGLLTIAYDSMKDTITAIRKAGFTGKIMVGGGATDQKVCDYVGADGYGADATDAVTLSKQWLG
ncbi:MAG: hypothetical protein GY870_01670 [archaeon]|nr:hypothetical protein [archaeon]